MSGDLAIGSAVPPDRPARPAKPEVRGTRVALPTSRCALRTRSSCCATCTLLNLHDSCSVMTCQNASGESAKLTGAAVVAQLVPVKQVPTAKQSPLPLNVYMCVPGPLVGLP